MIKIKIDARSGLTLCDSIYNQYEKYVILIYLIGNSNNNVKNLVIAFNSI